MRAPTTRRTPRTNAGAGRPPRPCPAPEAAKPKNRRGAQRQTTPKPRALAGPPKLRHHPCFPYGPNQQRARRGKRGGGATTQNLSAAAGGRGAPGRRPALPGAMAAQNLLPGQAGPTLGLRRRPCGPWLSSREPGPGHPTRSLQDGVGPQAPLLMRANPLRYDALDGISVSVLAPLPCVAHRPGRRLAPTCGGPHGQRGKPTSSHENGGGEGRAGTGLDGWDYSHSQQSECAL